MYNVTYSCTVDDSYLSVHCLSFCVLSVAYPTLPDNATAIYMLLGRQLREDCLRVDSYATANAH